MKRLSSTYFGKRSINALIMLLVFVLTATVSISITLLEKKHGWNIDMSFNSISTPDEVTMEIFETLNHPVHTYLISSGEDADDNLVTLLNRFSALCDKFTWELANPYERPALTQILLDEGYTQLVGNALIMTCDDTGRSAIIDSNRYIIPEYNINLGYFEERYQYEKAITEGLLQVSTGEKPTVMLLQTDYEFVMEGDMNLFFSYLDKNLYYPIEISLLRGDTLDGCRLLVIPPMNRDLRDSELASIYAYLESGGSLLTFHDYYGFEEATPNLTALYNRCGIYPMNGVVYAAKSAVSDYWEDRETLIPYVSDELFGGIAQELGNAMLLVHNNGFNIVEESLDAMVYSQAIAYSGEGTYLRKWSAENQSIDYQTGDPVGPIAIAVYSRCYHENGEESVVVALGSSSLFYDETHLYATENERFFKVLMSQLVSTDYSELLYGINSKEGIRPILTPDSRSAGTIVVIMLPIIIIICACAVLLPRRHM